MHNNIPNTLSTVQTQLSRKESYSFMTCLVAMATFIVALVTQGVLRETVFQPELLGSTYSYGCNCAVDGYTSDGLVLQALDYVIYASLVVGIMAFLNLMRLMSHSLPSDNTQTTN